MRIASLIVALMLAGCAAEPQWVWRKAGGSEQEYNMDMGQCRAQAFSVAGASLMQVAIVQNSCMQGKGWQQVAR